MPLHDRKGKLTDEHLGESLRSLPDARAGEGFTRAVLARVEETGEEAGTARAEAGRTGRPRSRGDAHDRRPSTPWEAWLPVPTPRLAAVLAVAVVAGLAAAPLLLDGPFVPLPVAERVAGGPEAPGATAPGDATAGGTGPGSGVASGPDADPRGSGSVPGPAGSGPAAPPPAGPDATDRPAGAEPVMGREESHGDAAATPVPAPGHRLAAVDLPAPTAPPGGPPRAPVESGGGSPEDGSAAAADAPVDGAIVEPGAGGSGDPGSATAPDGGSRPAPRAGVPGAPAPPATFPSGVRVAGLEGGAGSLRRAAPLDREAARQRLAELRQRQERLRAQLDALSATTGPGTAPALLLGGDESVELVLDLGPPRYAAAGGAGGTVRPAAHRQPGPERY